MKYRVLDLFSGIGGFSLAFKSIASTVAYCDIDPNSRDVLMSNIQKGLLDDATIFNDVTKINRHDLEHLKPNMITAGFPCTDISAANPTGQGLKGKHSGLFKHIIRIIDEIPSVQIVFLENSPRILKKGFSTVKKQMQNRGFSVKYIIVSAKDVGALHKRLRWYCLCTRSNPPLPLIHERFYQYPWDNANKVKRLLHVNLEKKKMAHIRCQLLGNTIVPQCAMVAWNTLCDSSGKKFIIEHHSPLDITISDGILTYQKRYWATPCRAIWHNYRSLTKRGSTVLSNQLYYDKRTTIDHKSIHTAEYIANPIFVESLMGYPKNWTKI